MAVVLKLVEDGIDAVDFVGSSSDYSLRQNGLALNLPEVERVVGGSPLLGEGQRLVERRYGNREITITFDIKAADHNALVGDMRALSRSLDTAAKTAKEGLGKKVCLHYKLDDANDEVVFDVLDGSFVPGSIASPTVRRTSSMLGCEITFICEPYARLDNPIVIKNLLQNGSFELSPAEGAQADMYYNLDTSAKYLSRASCTGLYGARLSAGIWVYWPSQQGAQAKVIQCGDDGSNQEAWLLEIDSANKPKFTWWDTADVAYTITAPDALSVDTWHFLGVCMWEEVSSAAPLTYDTAVLMVGGDVVGVDKQLNKTMRTPTGGFYIGRGSGAGAPFNGRVTHAFVIAAGNGIVPFQMYYIYKHGVKGMGMASSPNAPDQQYWGLEKADIGAIWSFAEGGLANDTSGNSRTLTVNGSPTEGVVVRIPSGWTPGSSFESKGGTCAGMHELYQKYGRYALGLDDHDGIGGDANFYVEQTITDGVLDAALCTLIFWARPFTGGLKIKWDADTQSIPIVTGWRQYIWTKLVVGGSTTVRILWDDASEVIAYVDGMELLSTQPFGTSYSTPTDITDNPVPYVGYHKVRAWPADAQVNSLDVYGIPGDVPATCRLVAENISGKELGPIRVGAQFGGEPGMYVSQLRACLLLPVYSLSTDYGSGVNPDLTTQTAPSIASRIKIPLPALFPWIGEQHGSFKLFIAEKNHDDAAAFFNLELPTSTIPLTSDPQQDEDSANVHLLDAGILTWPPAVAYTRIREGYATSRERVATLHLPALGIANWREAAATGPKYTAVWFLPIDGGNFTLQPTSADASKSFLQDGERLVIDTIDEDAAMVGYIAQALDLPTASATVPPIRTVLLSAAGLSLHGTGFFIPPNDKGGFFFMFSAGDTDHPIYGTFEEDNELSVSLEYLPRFLYV